MTYEDLIAVWTLAEAIDEAKSEVEELRLLAESLTRPLDGLPVVHSQNSRTEKIALKIVETEKKIEVMSEQLTAEKMKLFELIKATDLSPTLKRVLICRYVSCLPFNSIAKKIGYTRRHVSNLHNKALTLLDIDAA